jgi:hypothetical protein
MGHNPEIYRTQPLKLTTHDRMSFFGIDSYNFYQNS